MQPPPRAWPSGPVVVIALPIVALAVGAVLVLFPHRVARPVTPRVRIARVWNALSSQCQLESDDAPSRRSGCGAYATALTHRAPGSSQRPLVAITTDADSCVVDEETLEAFACQSSRVEWAAVEGHVVTLAAYSDTGTSWILTQQHLDTGERRALELSPDEWVAHDDPLRPVVVGPDGARAHVGFGALVPLP